MYAPNIGASKFIKQTLLNIKGQIDSDMIIVGDLKTPLSSVNKYPAPPKKTQHIKDILKVNKTINEMDLPNVCRVFHPIAVGLHILLSHSCNFPQLDHILGYKASLNKDKK
jgi:hypothetical protein